jgi:hypothetical protein
MALLISNAMVVGTSLDQLIKELPVRSSMAT